jgi:hypothetical protein
MKQIILVIVMAFLSSCVGETYRTNKAHVLTEKQKRAHHFLARQAHELTSENIENRDANVKKANRRLAKQQEELNNANKKTSKVSKNKKFNGEFNFY